MRAETKRITARARVVFSVALLVTLALVSPKIRGADEIEYFSHLRSFAFDRDLDFTNEYEHFVRENPQGLAAFKETFLDRREPLTGRPINFAPIGSAVLWAPFYALAHAAVVNGLARGPVDGFSNAYAAAVSYGSALLGALGFWILFRVLRQRFEVTESLALSAVLLAWFGTPALYYMTLAPAFSHAPALFAISVFLALWLRARERDRGSDWIWVGASLGLAALVREQAGLFIVLPATDLLLLFVRKRFQESFAAFASMTLAAAVVFSPQFLAYRAINGSFGPTKLVTRKMDYASPHALDVLFNPEHGLFFWTPLLVISLWGFLKLSREWKLTGVLVTLGFASQVYVNGAVLSWHQAGAFGSRRFVDATPFLVCGIAFGLMSLRTTACRVVVALAIWWNVSLMVQFGLKLMDRQRLDWPALAVRQVTEVPQHVLKTAKLYFTDRESLLRTPRVTPLSQ